jgi:hypothetical protein
MENGIKVLRVQASTHFSLSLEDHLVLDERKGFELVTNGLARKVIFEKALLVKSQ